MAFPRIDDVRAQLASGHVVGRLEPYPEDRGRELLVDGQVVPRELEKSSSLAAMLDGSPIWSYGFAGFRLGDFLPDSTREQLVMLHPYQPGQIPLVLVHGTFSSPATWAELVNELQNDPEIFPRFQPWLFLYPRETRSRSPAASSRRRCARRSRRSTPRASTRRCAGWWWWATARVGC